MGISTRRTRRRTVVGIDAAAQPKNIGLARGTVASSNFAIDAVAIGSTRDEIADIIASWCDDTTLIAIDAPLGWPAGLTRNLKGHRAGEVFHVEPNSMFRRRTDDFIHEAIGKRPLDVGADKIARASHSALDILGRVRRQLDQPIPLAWDPAESGLQAIEVYPAATLVSRGLLEKGYKGSQADKVAARRSLVASLGKEVEIGARSRTRAISSDHVLDAILCVVAGFDFVEGEAVSPGRNQLARQEGWIWARRPGRR